MHIGWLNFEMSSYSFKPGLFRRLDVPMPFKTLTAKSFNAHAMQVAYICIIVINEP